MKNYIFKIFFLLFSIVTFAQQEINTEFATKMNLAFQQLEKNRVPHGLLKNYAFEFTELAAYNGVVTDTNYVTPVALKQIYNTLLMARIHSNASQFITPQVYEQRWQTNRTAGVITLSGLLYNYAQFKPDAVPTGKLLVINNQYKDKYIAGIWQNPYDVKQTFAIAPSVRLYKGLKFSVKLPQNLWFTNFSQTVSSIQIDVSDGLGYRNIPFGQNLQVTYASSGIKRWFYKLTLSTGQIVYSHSKVVIEAGLVTIPHVNSSGGGTATLSSQASIASPVPTSAATLGRTNITASLPYSGSVGSAKIVIDYASSDRKIRKPLIVVEGFDPGVVTSPEEEFGNTDYQFFKFIINNSTSGQLQSLLTDINTKQYDIIWVDWNNGVDFIQRNAYVLEAVIQWVNAEKAANGSTVPNVVLGASMGGLIARYALKDMEDRFAATGNAQFLTKTGLYVSHDAPHLGANVPLGYQYLSRHALNQYMQTPFALLAGEVILPLFSDGPTPLDTLLLQNQPAAKQMLINFVQTNYVINNSVHDAWQAELRTKGYPSMRKIAISNGNHCAEGQNGLPGGSLLSIDGRYSTGWLTDVILSYFPAANATIFKLLALFSNESAFLVGILPGSSKLTIDFKINSSPLFGTSPVYKGKITFTKTLLWLADININITNKNFTSPPNALPIDSYPGGAFETGIRNSSSASGTSFWQTLFYKYNMNITTEPTFTFVPTASALDIGLGNVALTANDYSRKYNSVTPPVAPKNSPFNNFITSFQSSFVVNNDDGYQSTNEHHIYLHKRNADWLAKEIDNTPNNNDSFDCSYMCSNTEIIGANTICTTANYTIAQGNATTFNWTVSQLSGLNLVTLSGNGTPNVTLNAISQLSGYITLSLTCSDGSLAKCGSTTITKKIWVGLPVFQFSRGTLQSELCDIKFHEVPFILRLPPDTSLNINFLYPNVTYSQTGSNTYIFKFMKGYSGPFTIEATATNSCGSFFYESFDEHFIQTCAQLGLDNLTVTDNTNLYRVYPNPSTSLVSIHLRDQDLKPELATPISGELFDIFGFSRANVQIIDNKANFSVVGLPKGIYVLKINVDDKVESHQIVVE